MPFDVPLPRKLKAAGWKVKIREKEPVEPPHVTIMHKADEWRLGLRDQRLLVSPGGRIKDIDPAVMEIIEEHCDVRNCRRGRTVSGESGLRRRVRMRGTKRTDFAPISAREIAGIDRNEIVKPHARTLETIASGSA